MTASPACSSFPYALLKKYLLEKQPSYEQFCKIKEIFYGEINSHRLYSRIVCFKDLLDTLEQRGVISEDNPKLLERIIPSLGDNEWKKEMYNYQPSKIKCRWNDKNIYSEGRMLFSTNDKCRNEIPRTHLKLEPAIRDAVFKLIASDIGRKWREFGRHLGIKEGQMDELDIRFQNDLGSKVVKMLTIFEEAHLNDRRLYVERVCQALVECRRTDLQRKIIEIIPL